MQAAFSTSRITSGRPPLYDGIFRIAAGAFDFREYALRPEPLLELLHFILRYSCSAYLRMMLFSIITVYVGYVGIEKSFASSPLIGSRFTPR